MTSYFIGIVPDKDTSREIDTLRDKFGCKSGRTTPPHITLVPPFVLKGTAEVDLIGILGNIHKEVSPQTITLDRFGYFKGRNNVVFLEPNQQSQAYLKKLVNTIYHVVCQISGLSVIKAGFEPQDRVFHLTVVKQISDQRLKHIINQTKKNFSEYVFTVDSVALFRQGKDFSRWEIIGKISLVK